MTKKGKRDSKVEREKIRRRKSPMFWLVGIVLGGGVLFTIFFLFPKNQPWGLPAFPRNPRAATLSPALFTGEAAKAYQIAQEVPELLERMPCYCGCYVNPGHRNNLDCYTDRHGAG